MKSKIVLITGGNSGIGKATALALARQGATIVITARNEAAGQAALAEINQQTAAVPARLLLLDLASFESIQRAVERFRQSHPRLDVLINNAGVFTSQLEHTREEFELQFGVNYLGPFLLSHLLLPALMLAPSPRVVNVSSRGHYGGLIDFDNLRGEKGQYSGLRSYAQSKLANVLFTREWARRFPTICANCLQPGIVRTQIANKYSAWYIWLIWSLGKPFFISPERGAATSIYLASSPEVEGVSGRYFDQKQRECRPSPMARDAALARRLWEVSAKLTSKWHANEA